MGSTHRTEHRTEHRTGGRVPLRTAVVRTAALLGSLALAAGCSQTGGAEGGADGDARGGDRPSSGVSAAPRTATGSLEQLAEKTKCKPDMQSDAEEVRQGVCTTKDGRYVLATFATAKGQRAWLTEAKIYGGTYLVGRKWVAVSEPKVLGKLRGRLGGALETGASHSEGEGSHSDGTKNEEHQGHRGS